MSIWVLNIIKSYKAVNEKLGSLHCISVKWYAGQGPVVEIKDFLENLTLQETDLDKVEHLCFDGGNRIYHMLKPDWDGEDDLFDVVSVEGFEYLKNLKTVDYISMCHPEVLEPLEKAGVKVQY